MTIAARYIPNKSETIHTNAQAIIDEVSKAASTYVSFNTTPAEARNIDLLLVDMQQTSNVVPMSENIEFLVHMV